MARGRTGGFGAAGESAVWRNITGSHECFPFRVKNGKGFVYEGRDYDEPGTPVATRADWMVSRGGRTYVLYDVAPGSMEDYMFVGEFQESLWIGLVGKDGKILRKAKLATGVKDISGVRRAKNSNIYVSATTAAGVVTNIDLVFPEPWPELRPTGDVVEDFNMREQREWDVLYEDWPDNGSGYAADWVSNRVEEWLEGECRSAVEVLQRAAVTDAERAELAREMDMARSKAFEIAGSSADTAMNVHWGNFVDRITRMQVLEVYLANWLEAGNNPEGWKAVRHASGTLHGVAFAATGGVAVITLPSEDDQLLLRLSPARVMSRDGFSFTYYELVAPSAMDSSLLVESGTVAISGPARR